MSHVSKVQSAREGIDIVGFGCGVTRRIEQTIKIDEKRVIEIGDLEY